MKKITLKFCAVLLIVATLFAATAVDFSAATAGELRQNISKLEAESKKIEAEIKELQGQINKQQELKEAIQRKINNLQSQINACNAEINKINEKIAKNKAEIKKKEKQIQADRKAYKKRLRAIQMSNNGSDLQVLLGAESFAEFLQLAQYTAAVSARDRKLIDRLTAGIKALEKKQKENNKLLEEQLEIRKTISQKQSELQAENQKIQSVINKIDGTQSQLESDNKKIEQQIKEYNKTLASMASAGGSSFVYDGGAFLWPTPGFYGISAYFQSNDPVHRGHHNGVDIAGGGIAGARIVAIADGVVTRSNNSCTHNYKKWGSCGCGGGYGNYVSINHGTNAGKTYVATYGHMTSTAVSAGATVKKGQTIGYVGTTGWSTGYHLHFGLAVNGYWVNPMNYFRRVG